MCMSLKRNKSARRPCLESIERRILLSVFNLAGGATDAALRADITSADTNTQASNTIDIGAGILALTSTASGNLLIENGNSAMVADKTLIIDGAGRTSTVIEPSA